MTEIIPAIIPKDFRDLEDKMSLVSGLIAIVQIDVLDGKLTPSKSWPFVNTPDQDFLRIIKEDEGFPFWEELDFEVDLMVEEPEKYIEDWVKAGAKRVILHFESFGNIERAKSAIAQFKDKFSIPGSPLNIEIGIAVGVETPDESYKELISEVDFIQFMGINKIGFQGESFDERVLNKIENTRKEYPKVIISVDGGVSLDSAPKLVQAGANRLVSGSAIFGSDDILGTIEELENIK